MSRRPPWLLRLVGVPIAVMVARGARLSRRRVGLALLYHRVEAAQGDQRREIVPALGAGLFAAQLRHLTSHYRLVAAAELQDAVLRRRRGEKFPVAITFDDDHPSHTAVTLPLLASAGAPATFFLTGSSLHEPRSFWWEDLQKVAVRGDVHGVSEAIQRLQPQDRAQVVGRLRVLAGDPPPDAGLRRGGVEALVDGGCEIGFHTVSHEPLTTLDDAELAEALRAGRDELEQLTRRPLRTMAYPHGKVDSRVAAAARTAGFAYGFTTEAVAVRPDSDPLLLGRLSPSFASTGHFALQLARRLLPRIWPL